MGLFALGHEIMRRGWRLRSSTSTSFVRKKAALTLLRLYRKHPTVMAIGDWADRIVTMMDDSDPGVSLTITSLVTAMAQDNLEAFSGCYQKAVDRLDRVSQLKKVPGELTCRSYLIMIIPSSTSTTKSQILGYKSAFSVFCNTILLQVSFSKTSCRQADAVDNQQVTEMLNGILQAIIDMSQEAPRVSLFFATGT